MAQGHAPDWPHLEHKIPEPRCGPRPRHRRHGDARQDEDFAGTGFYPDPRRRARGHRMALRRFPQQPRSPHRRERSQVPDLGTHRQAMAYLRVKKAGHMSHAKKALIVGGGVAGPVAAMAIKQARIDSVVYEAYAGGADGAGGFLTFASNGMDALYAIDAHHLVLAEGFPTPRMTIQNGTGKHLGEVPLGGELPHGTGRPTLKGADLYRTLRD